MPGCYEQAVGKRRSELTWPFAPASCFSSLLIVPARLPAFAVPPPSAASRRPPATAPASWDVTFLGCSGPPPSHTHSDCVWLDAWLPYDGPSYLKIEIPGLSDWG